jgi:acyl-CoA synthetase (AMP-forming)/AMP-acid ligase II
VSILPDLVRRSAECWPDHPAVVMDGRSFSYGNLEAASNQIARTLKRCGVGAGDRVMLWLPKSPEAIATLYGIMKAGAAYVSVDPSAPPQRACYIARDCAAAALITVPTRAGVLDKEFAGTAPMSAVLYAESARDIPPIAGINAISWSEIQAESEMPSDSGVTGKISHISSIRLYVYTSIRLAQPDSRKA